MLESPGCSTTPRPAEPDRGVSLYCRSHSRDTIVRQASSLSRWEGIRKEVSMQLGFVSAILGDQSLEQVLALARDEGFDCVEVMCWPPGGAERRYAGVSHLDVDHLEPDRVRDLLAKVGVGI